VLSIMCRHFCVLAWSPAAASAGRARWPGSPGCGSRSRSAAAPGRRRRSPLGASRTARHELGHDVGQARGELLGRAERHRAQQLDGSLFVAPRVLVERVQQRRAARASRRARSACPSPPSPCRRWLSARATRVAEAQQQVRQDVDDVGLEQAAQHAAQHLEREQRASRRFTFFLSWMASVSVSMMPSCFSDRMPRPFTRPAMPCAAPLRSP